MKLPMMQASKPAVIRKKIDQEQCEQLPPTKRYDEPVVAPSPAKIQFLVGDQHQREGPCDQQINSGNYRKQKSDTDQQTGNQAGQEQMQESHRVNPEKPSPTSALPVRISFRKQEQSALQNTANERDGAHDQRHQERGADHQPKMSFQQFPASADAACEIYIITTKDNLLPMYPD
jgi:hypothetical protein